MYSHYKKNSMTFTPVWEVPSRMTQHSLSQKLFIPVHLKCISINMTTEKLSIYEEASSGHICFVIQCLQFTAMTALIFLLI